MTEEKRRYFRIDETIGLSITELDKVNKEAPADHMIDIWDLMSDQDAVIEKLLEAAEEESPKVAALIRAFNQKIERIVGQLVLESRMVDKLANRVREVNISACGIGFLSDKAVEVGTRLQLEIELFPDSTKLQTKGRVVGCEEASEGFYLRLDFFDMSNHAQEQLIQHIVKRQSAQLKSRSD